MIWDGSLLFFNPIWVSEQPHPKSIADFGSDFGLDNMTLFLISKDKPAEKEREMKVLPPPFVF